MSTHAAVVTTAPRAPLEVLQVPDVPPSAGEILVQVQWTASTPFDLHQADGGLLCNYPQVMGDGYAGRVINVGEGVKNLKVGDEVFGFGWREQKERAHQELVCTTENVLGKIPAGFTMQEAVTVPNNFVTAMHTLSTVLDLQLPWPRPVKYTPTEADDPILIWGASSSVGQYTIQILKYFGFRNVIVTASQKHHQMLQGLGAAACFDYRSSNVANEIITHFRNDSRQVAIPFIIDCIGSKNNSLAVLAKIARPGAHVAVMLPVIVRDATDNIAPEYSQDASASVPWESGVQVSGVRTHFYLENTFFAEHLQPTIMPAMLEEGIIKPNRYRIIEAPTLVQRAQAALDALRRKEVSGERLVWRVSQNVS